MLRAYEKLNNKDWGLILVGDGPEMQNIQKYIQTHKLENVFLPGFLDENELAKYYTYANVFVLPSISEPWGLVTNEAMAAGLPVIISQNCGCYPDLIEEGKNGFSFEPSKKDMLYNILKKITSKESNLKKMGQQSQKIIQPHNFKNVAEKISLFLNSPPN